MAGFQKGSPHVTLAKLAIIACFRKLSFASNNVGCRPFDAFFHMEPTHFSHTREKSILEFENEKNQNSRTFKRTCQRSPNIFVLSKKRQCVAFIKLLCLISIHANIKFEKLEVEHSRTDKKQCFPCAPIAVMSCQTYLYSACQTLKAVNEKFYFSLQRRYAGHKKENGCDCGKKPMCTHFTWISGRTFLVRKPSVCSYRFEWRPSVVVLCSETKLRRPPRN